jgi:hypothetical protein
MTIVEVQPDKFTADEMRIFEEYAKWIYSPPHEQTLDACRPAVSLFDKAAVQSLCRKELFRRIDGAEPRLAMNDKGAAAVTRLYDSGKFAHLR